MKARTRSAAVVGACLVLAGAGLGQPAPSAGGSQPVQGVPGEFATAADLLAALETADRGLRRLSAKVEYTKTFADGDVHKREGMLYFTSDPSPGGATAGRPDHRRFAVVFDKFFRGDRLEEDDQVFAFDGQWLMEKHPNEKEFHLRQVVRPGEVFDPLKIGQGPFPLPLGQKKDDILAEYDAELLPAADGLALEDADGASDADRELAQMLTDDVKGCWQVRLTPKAGRAEDAEFSEVRLWYKRDKTDRLLPRMARTEAATDDPGIPGDIAMVRLISPKVNEAAEIKEGVFDVTRPEGWEGRVDELPKPETGPATRPGR